MKTYHAKFSGRKRNAIGLFYPVFVTIQAEDATEAKTKLYEAWEHISGLNLREVVP